MRRATRNTTFSRGTGLHRRWGLGRQAGSASKSVPSFDFGWVERRAKFTKAGAREILSFCLVTVRECEIDGELGTNYGNAQVGILDRYPGRLGAKGKK